MRRSALVISWLVSALLVLSAGVTAQPGKVVIYSALDSAVTNEVLKFFERSSGLKTEALTLAAAGTLATRIRAESARPQADIFLGGSVDFHAPLAKDGLLVPYVSPRLSEAKLAREFHDPAGYWYHEWMVDVPAPGAEVLEGSVYLQIPKERIHILEGDGAS